MAVDRPPREWGETRSRHHFAGSLVRGKSVLVFDRDGSAILADAGAAVAVLVAGDAASVGETVHPEVVRCVGDRLCLPVGDAAVDIAVGEISDPLDDETRELRRVISPGGAAVLNMAVGRTQTARERVRSSLSSHFSSVELLGQVPRPAFPVYPPWGVRPEGPSAGLRMLCWHLCDALPLAIKDPLARLIRNRAFYPGEYDFLFTTDGASWSPWVVAICRV